MLHGPHVQEVGPDLPDLEFSLQFPFRFFPHSHLDGFLLLAMQEP